MLEIGLTVKRLAKVLKLTLTNVYLMERGSKVKLFLDNANIPMVLNISENGKKASLMVKELCTGLVNQRNTKENSSKVNQLVRVSKLHPKDQRIKVIGLVVSSSMENHQRMSFKNNMKKLWTLKLLTKKLISL